MGEDFHRDFEDLNKFVGLGEDLAYHAPVLEDRLRAWPLDQWAQAPREPGQENVRRCNWKGVRLLNGNVLERGDYFIIEDMIPAWRHYSPNLLPEYLAAFREVLAMDTLYSNTCPQLDGGVFRRL